MYEWMGREEEKEEIELDVNDFGVGWRSFVLSVYYYIYIVVI